MFLAISVVQVYTSSISWLYIPFIFLALPFSGHGLVYICIGIDEKYSMLILQLELSGITRGANGDVACDQYHKYKVQEFLGYGNRFLSHAVGRGR